MSGMSAPARRVDVALAVPAFVVMANAGPNQIHVGQVADDHVAEDHVLLDDLVFLGRQLARLAQDVVRDPDLPDVVEQTRDADRVDETGVTAGLFGQEHAVPGDVAGSRRFV